MVLAHIIPKSGMEWAKWLKTAPNDPWYAHPPATLGLAARAPACVGPSQRTRVVEGPEAHYGGVKGEAPPVAEHLV